MAKFFSGVMKTRGTDTEPVRPARMLTGFEQTRLSWAQRVESFDDTPAMFHDALRTLGATPEAFPYAVLTPTFEGFLRRPNQKLITSRGDSIYILENINKKIVTTRYAVPLLSYVEVGSILLKAWLTLRGVNGEGALTTSTLEFNAVTERLFTPFLYQMRGAAWEGGRPVNEPNPFVSVPGITYKFINYANRSLLPGERVEATVWQPEMRTPRVTFFGKTWYRTDAPAHILILTARELILLREDETEHALSSTRYGGIWTYVPLEKIEALILKPETSTLHLTIHLPHGDRIQILFEADKKRDAEKLIDAFANLRSSQSILPRNAASIDSKHIA